MILPIYTYGQPVLRKQCEDFDPTTYPDLQQLIQNMYETMKRSEGVGLAAPQIGKALRLAVIGLDDLKEDYPEYEGYLHAFINPHIVEVDDSEMVSQEEGCLSLPGIHEPVKRPARIRVQWLDENLEAHDEWVEGFLARVMQHEFDHLDGKVFTDRIAPLRKQMVKSKLNAIMKGKVNCSYRIK